MSVIDDMVVKFDGVAIEKSDGVAIGKYDGVAVVNEKENPHTEGA